MDRGADTGVDLIRKPANLSTVMMHVTDGGTGAVQDPELFTADRIIVGPIAREPGGGTVIRDTSGIAAGDDCGIQYKEGISKCHLSDKLSNR